MPSKAFVIVAHGSRLRESNEEIETLVEAVQERSPEIRVSTAFLEFAKPTLADRIDGLTKAGIWDISVFPYFLGTGVHVSNDIPKILADKRSQYRGHQISIHLLSHLGADPDLLTLLVGKAASL